AGSALYVDDMPLREGHLHVAIGLSSVARGTIKAIDLSAVRTAPGVVDAVVQADIPGKVDIAPVFTGDPLLAGPELLFAGQGMFAVSATSISPANRALSLSKVDIEQVSERRNLLSAMAAEVFVAPLLHIERGNLAGTLANAEYTVSGTLEIGGQEHFSLE